MMKNVPITAEVRQMTDFPVSPLQFFKAENSSDLIKCAGFRAFLHEVEDASGEKAEGYLIDHANGTVKVFLHSSGIDYGFCAGDGPFIIRHYTIHRINQNK